MNEALLSEPYYKIKRRLAEPIPAELIRSRPQGGAEIEYINITDYKDLLDDRCGHSVWEAIVSDYKQVGESLSCVVKLVIHCEDGSYAQDGTGIEPLNVSGYGDPFSNAYAQAFRRACEGHGLSRELWRCEHGQQRPVPVVRPMNGQPHETAAAKAVNLGELVTAKQLGMIRALARELRIEPDAECLSVMSCRTDELSKNAASSLIKHLQELSKGGPAMPLRQAR